jgi:hypothetical protein
MTKQHMRVVAVDWSGDRSGGAKQIWLAEAWEGRITRLEPGRTRDQLVDSLIDEGAKSRNMVVGLDFAFSMPTWFVESQGATNGPEFWTIVAEKGEGWLLDCSWPFYGKYGSPMPADVELLRRTEWVLKEVSGISPSSVFLLAGGKQVGTGSIRGMPQLARCRDAGWHVWPFDPPKFPLVIEIFPRIFMGRVVKKAPMECLGFLSSRFPNLDRHSAARAASNDDAFDATVSALVMSEHQDPLRFLPDLTDGPTHRIEGRIWSPTEWPT